MIDKPKAKDNVSATITCNSTLKSKMYFKNPVKVECFDKEGNLVWVEENFNLITNQGLDDVLDVYFSDGSQDTTHYIGLKGTGAAAAGDTLASHAGWTEFTSYTGDRKAWTEAGVSGQAITNAASPASFTSTGDGTVGGAFLCNVATGTTGVLVAVVDFASSKVVGNEYVINITYGISLAAS